MASFSERYGYESPHKAVVQESMPEDIVNVLCTLFDLLIKQCREDRNNCFKIDEIEMNVWCYFLNKRRNDIYNYQGYQKPVIIPFLSDKNNRWNTKLDLIEYVVQYMVNITKKHPRFTGLLNQIVEYINHHFERLHYGYRVVNYYIAPITSKEEIKAIELALEESKDNVRTHLLEAVALFSNRENPNFRNSIKESISAVEVVCRDLTGKRTLGESLSALEKQGVVIHKQLKSAFEKLYAYTNQEGTGVRHGLMDADGTYVPTYNEAYFMLISCSAFINYIRGIVA